MPLCDSSVHLSHRHGLLDVEIQSVLSSRADTDDQSTEMLASPSLEGSSNYATAQDLEAKRILDGMMRRGGDTVMENIQEGV